MSPDFMILCKIYFEYLFAYYLLSQLKMCNLHAGAISKGGTRNFAIRLLKKVFETFQRHSVFQYLQAWWLSRFTVTTATATHYHQHCHH